MSYEGIKNEQEKSEFRSEIQKMIERYALIEDKMSEYRGNDKKEGLSILKEELDHQIEEIAKTVILEVKKSNDKERILDDFTDAFRELNRQRTEPGFDYYEDQTDDATNIGSREYFLRKIILGLVS